MTRHNLLVCAATAILALALAPAARAQLITKVIDNFSEEQFVIVNGSPSGVKSATSVVDKTGSNIILGGERDILLTRTSPNKGSIIADISQSATGIFALSTSLNTTGSALLTYDGNDNDASSLDATGLGGVDFTVLGGDSIYFLATTDLGGTVTVTVYTNGVNYSTSTVNLTPSASYTPYLLPFSAFAVGGGTGANFASVGAVTVRVTANVAEADIGLDLVGVVNSTAVPETGSTAFAAVAGTMVAGLVLRRRRRAA